MIDTVNLTKRFGNFTAVDNLNLNIAKGEIFGFLGANGAGKTTTIRILCGLTKPSSGTATVGGFDVNKHSEQIKTVIGYMSQKFALYNDLKAKENLAFYASVYRQPLRIALERLNPLLETMGLTSILNSFTRDLPMGYKQRLSLVCALVHDPPILFLDEPTSGVDPQARREFWDMINQLAIAGKTVIVSTHFMDEAEYCHRVIVMRDGKEVAMGNPTELKQLHQSKNMQELFLKLARGE
ncbi:MAG: ABC transporter ATP-binding protein [Candidatus Cloacimonas sp.]|jgi:ABC-2 type transport system ATP-binding protein|nr:ABC transporter ATP-binding protein [Candidatus Cloacimonas sp.]